MPTIVGEDGFGTGPLSLITTLNAYYCSLITTLNAYYCRYAHSSTAVVMSNNYLKCLLL